MKISAPISISFSKKVLLHANKLKLQYLHANLVKDTKKNFL